MTEQFSLPGFDPPTSPTDNLFFAVRPDAQAADRIAALTERLRGEHGLKGKSLGVGRFHVTLHPLGDSVGVPLHVVAAATEAAAAVAMAPFDVVFDHALSFGRKRNRPVVLGGGEGLATITSLQGALGLALKKTTLGHVVRTSFTPHLTLLYDDRGIDLRAVEPIHWIAREFLLVRSLLGRSQHEVLGRWPLRG